MNALLAQGSGGGDESDREQLTRNWNELLQELRVTQTGVQILTGFLLTVPFTSRFPDLDTLQRYAYLGVLTGSIIATGLIVAPVAFHRLLFRQGQKPWLVRAANNSARAGLGFLAFTVSGVAWLCFSVVINRPAATTAMVVALVYFLALWGGVPLIARNRDD